MWKIKLINKVVDWYLRKTFWTKSIASLLLIITIIISGFSIKLRIFETEIEINNSNIFPLWFIVFITVSSFLLIIFFGIIEYIERSRKHTIRMNQKVLVIEQRGLIIGGDDDTLMNSIANIYPKECIISKLIDIRNCYNNSIFDPECALPSITNVKSEVKSLLSNYDQSNTGVIFGGLSPVPITFLTGFLLDDEFRLDIYDWDRTNQKWFQVEDNEKLELEKFKISDIESIENNDEIVFTISVSYSVDHKGINKLFPSLPKVDLTFNSIDKDNHWNLKTQKQLTDAFLATLKLISQKGIKKVHLFIAAQNSVVFNLARIYDQRNLPMVYVYQYERSFDPPYAWAIKMPTHGIDHPEVIKIDIENSTNNNNT